MRLTQKSYGCYETLLSLSIAKLACNETLQPILIIHLDCIMKPFSLSIKESLKYACEQAQRSPLEKDVRAI